MFQVEKKKIFFYFRDCFSWLKSFDVIPDYILLCKTIWNLSFGNIMKNTEIIRIFLSSPSDVSMERQRILLIANEMNKSLGLALGRNLEIIGWENVTPSIETYPQQVINKAIDEYDVFLGLFALRFGTPTLNAESGTEEEFNIALEKYKRAEIKDICMLFKQDGFNVSEIDIDQLAAVNRFKKKISTLGCYRVDFRVDSFDEEIRKLFIKLIVEWDKIKNRNFKSDTCEAETVITLDDGEIGYYDAIYKAIDEINESEKVSIKLTEVMKKLNEAMNNTKFRLEVCIDDRMRMNIINKFADDMIVCADSLNFNLNREKEFLLKSLRNFNIAAEILSEDFSDGKNQLQMVLPYLLNYKKTFESRIISNEKMFGAFSRFPRATTKLNGARKKLLKTLDELKVNSEQLIDAFEESLNKVMGRLDF